MSYPYSLCSASLCSASLCSAQLAGKMIAMLTTTCLIAAILLSADLATAQEPDSKQRDAQNRFYAHDRLVKIKIKMSDKDWLATRIAHRSSDMSRIAEDPYEYVKAEVEIDGVTFKNVGVRKKGFFGSVVSTRPSLKIRFDKYDKQQQFHGLDQLTLNNNVQDATNVHQLVAYRLFQDAGVPSPRCNLAVVTVNGEDLGVYSNVESIRKPFLKRVFKNSDGILYEGYAGDFDEKKEELKRVVSKRGKPESNREPLEALHAVLYNKQSTLEDIDRKLDLDAFITYWAAEVLMGHWDGYSGNRNNYYLYLNSKDGKFYFVPWGADSIFWDPGPFVAKPVPKSVKAMSAICRKLWERPEIRKRHRKEMKRLLDTVWKEDEINDWIQQAQKRLEPFTVSQSSMSKLQFASIKAFVETRRDAIQKELDGDAPDWPDVSAENPEQPQGESIEISGTFEAKMRGSAPLNPFGQGKVTIEIKEKDKDASQPFKNVGVYVLPEQAGFIRPGYPSMTIIGQHKDNPGDLLVISFAIDPIRLKHEAPKLKVDMFCVWAFVIRGNPQSPDADRKMFDVRGTLTLDKFGKEKGSEIKGSYQLTMPAFKKN